MPDKFILRRKNLVENPTARVPVCLVLDCSPSMGGDPKFGSAQLETNPRPIDALNEGVRSFYKALNADPVARYAAEVAVIRFSTIQETVRDFAPIESETPPHLELEVPPAGTHLGKAVLLGLKILDARKKEYQDAGVDYFQPWLVLMTDGKPTAGDECEDGARAVNERIQQGKLTIFPLGIGAGADMSVLQAFSPKKPALRLRGLRFAEFFEWLSKSVSQVSNSMPGEKVTLDLEGIKSWAEL